MSPSNNKIKAVIFDMDGVLIEAKDWHYEALNRALSLFGMEISRHDHEVTYDGLPTHKKLELLTEEMSLPRSLHKFINEQKQKHTIDHVHQNCKPIFQHEFALSRLKSEGYKLAVCSNSIKTSVDLMMRKSNLMKYLDFFLSNEDVSSPKPNPEIYNMAIERLGVRPEECLVLEDNPHGLKAAYASGAKVLKIENVMEVNYFNIINCIKGLENS